MSTHVFVNYPQEEGADFNVKYYLNTHMKLVDKHWRPYGLKSWKVLQFAKDDPSGIRIQTQLVWESMEAFDKAWAANIPELMEDLPNYTTIVPYRAFPTLLAEGCETDCH